MEKASLRLVPPSTEVRTVTPLRVPNKELRTREYLTEAEVDRLIAAAKGNRYPGTPGLPRPPQHPAHGQILGAGAR